MELHFGIAAKVRLFFIAIVTLMAKNATGANYLRNETDRLALLNVKLQILDDPEGVLKSWNDSLHHCYWEGVTCDVRHHRVTSLTLQGKSLLGPISPYIGNLSFLKFIRLGENRFNGEIPQEIGHLFRLKNLNLSSNTLSGEIPQEIGRLFRLKNLNLSSNTLSGEIPVNLSQCSELRNISIFRNGLVGKIPTELGSLKNLVLINLFQNNLTKEIPSSFGNLSSLRAFFLGYNHLEGNLPNEIGSLRNLLAFSLESNKLSGLFPPSIYNMSTVFMVSLSENFLEGKLPNDIGLKMPNLQWLTIGKNQFYGNIPSSIINATNLQIFDIAFNQFKGQVPTKLGNLPMLRVLNIPENILGYNASGDMHFITSLTNCSRLQVLVFAANHFGGQLPQSIGNLSIQVQAILMGGNKISGAIPISLMRLSNLYELAMQENYFTGTIPREFGKLQRLQLLALSTNMLTGEIPSTLCNLTSLYALLLGANKLEGTLPPCLGNSQSLNLFNISGNKLFGIISTSIFGNSFSPLLMDLSHNSFTGPLPLEVGRLAHIITFDVSHNNLFGQIPGTLGDCSDLQQLSMQANFFQGTIPPRLASLKGIQYLDLSQNNLIGQIPKNLERLPSLNYLNLSVNNLEGEVPKNGVFSNSSQIILNGNFKLCGGIPELQLPFCTFHCKKNWKLVIIIISCSLILITLILISTKLLYYYQRRYFEPLEKDKFLRISYNELQRATRGFSQESIVGSGSFGVVYKGQLDQQNGIFVAVKVLDLQKNGVFKSFKAECNALRNIRHRNLVSILSYCSSIDYKGDEFKALVYDFMENGSLDMWLHLKTSDGIRLRNLNIHQRVNIAVDVAYALQYLHHHCEVVVAHCDLKPSNILLDNELTAHVGDFGLARLISKASSGNETSSSIAIKGTIGYSAPEFAMGCEASTQGDVYSYGILLLEMFTGKRPTDEIFINDLNMHNYVKRNLSERVEEILDPLLLSRQGQDNTDDEIIIQQNYNGSIANLWWMMNCIISIFEIGLKCSETSPNDRLDMNEVTRKLLSIKDAFLHGER